VKYDLYVVVDTNILRLSDSSKEHKKLEYFIRNVSSRGDVAWLIPRGTIDELRSQGFKEEANLIHNFLYLPHTLPSTKLMKDYGVDVCIESYNHISDNFIYSSIVTPNFIYYERKVELTSIDRKILENCDKSDRKILATPRVWGGFLLTLDGRFYGSSKEGEKKISNKKKMLRLYGVINLSFLREDEIKKYELWKLCKLSAERCAKNAGKRANRSYNH